MHYKNNILYLIQLYYIRDKKVIYWYLKYKDGEKYKKIDILYEADGRVRASVSLSIKCWVRIMNRKLNWRECVRKICEKVIHWPYDSIDCLVGWNLQGECFLYWRNFESEGNSLRSRCSSMTCLLPCAACCSGCPSHDKNDSSIFREGLIARGFSVDVVVFILKVYPILLLVFCRCVAISSWYLEREEA